MFRTLQDLMDVSVVASDGEMGKIRDFLFDDQSWNLCYFVVEVGGWLARRDVVIWVTAVEPPDWEHKAVRVRLSKEQVRNSPDVDTTKPVSRQQELAMREYYGWPPFLDENTLEGAFSSPPTGREFPVHTPEDRHLRSAEYVLGYEVWDAKGQIGRLDNFIVDEDSWHIGYLDVRAGDWLHFRSLLLSTHWVASISWAQHRVDMRQSGREARTPLGVQ